ncbi:hypothetical protein GCM10009850_020360 [Nonomuraea monospora]|uniref:Uncharacterized protein n=1 Tax=Nonomuraea monospora TaxID=568818 RepID=A0ABN3CB36_9ACTN
MRVQLEFGAAFHGDAIGSDFHAPLDQLGRAGRATNSFQYDAVGIVEKALGAVVDIANVRVGIESYLVSSQFDGSIPR